MNHFLPISHKGERFFRFSLGGSAEIDQLLRALVALTENSGSSPSSHVVAHNRSRDQTPSSDLQACAWCSCTHAGKTCNHTQNSEFIIIIVIFMNLLNCPAEFVHNCLSASKGDVCFLNTHISPNFCVTSGKDVVPDRS